LPYALVISEPVSVPAEINTANRLADYATATNPEAERIELDADSVSISKALTSPGGAGDINQWPRAQVDVIKKFRLRGVIVGD
jgi:sulfur relay (sulfurtransferase) complex TusBCD TusD component (DsrE family)